MEKLMGTVTGYLGAFTQEQWLWLGLVGVIVLYIMYNKKKYAKLFDNAVVMAETSFNSGEGEKKMEAAVQFVIARTETLPLPAKLILRAFINEKRMKDIIEKSLQKFSNVFGTGRKVDIKGNE